MSSFLFNDYFFPIHNVQSLSRLSHAAAVQCIASLNAQRSALNTVDACCSFTIEA